jgi:N-acetylglutamate synthase-like GNAT family acetyltransferase
MIIRPANTNDIPSIRHIASLTWPVAYASILSPGQMQYMLNSMYSEAVLRGQMTTEGHQFFMAEMDGSAIGFAGCSPVEQPHTWKLHKLYVLPNIQKTGAGKALMEKVLETAKGHGATTLLLNVNRNNPAYHYYIKNGFSTIETGDFDIGNGFFMNDYVMAKKLN